MANNSATNAAERTASFLKVRLGVLIGSPFEIECKAAFTFSLRGDARAAPRSPESCTAHFGNKPEKDVVGSHLEIGDSAMLLRETLRRAIGSRQALLQLFGGETTSKTLSTLTAAKPFSVSGVSLHGDRDSGGVQTQEPWRLALAPSKCHFKSAPESWTIRTVWRRNRGLRYHVH